MSLVEVLPDVIPIGNMAPTGQTIRIERLGNLEEKRLNSLTWAQHWTWVRQYEDPGAAPLILGDDIAIPAGVSEESVVSAFDQVVERHESLRARFSIGADALPGWEAVADRVPVRVVHTDAAGADQVCGRVRNELLMPFDLETGPAIRACLVVVDGVPNVLLVSFHHIAVDAAAMLVFRAELTSEMKGGSCAVTGQVSPTWTPDQQAEWEGSDEGELHNERALAYWRRLQLRQPFDLPPLRFRQLSADGSSVRLVSKDLALRCSELSRRERCTVSAIISTAIAASLANVRGRDSVLISPRLSNRTSSKTSGYLGMHMSSVWLLVDCPRHAEFRTVVRSNWMSMMEAIRHGKYNSGQMWMEMIADGLNQAYNGSFNFNYVKGDSGGADLPLGLSSKKDETRCEEKVEIYDWGQQMEVYLMARTDILDFDALAAIAEGLPSLIERFADDPEVRLSELPGVLPRWIPPSDQWRDIRGRWIFLPDLRDALRAIEGVEESEVFISDHGGFADRLICSVALGANGSSEAVIEYLGGEPLLGGTVVIPDVLLVCDTAPGDWTNLDSWLEAPDLRKYDFGKSDNENSYRSDRVPTDMEGRLLSAFHKVHPQASASPLASYGEAGGAYVKIPSMLRCLQDGGLTGLTVQDFMSTLTMRALAERLRRS